MKAHEETKILEVGCGSGNNLWFCAREGFQVTGMDKDRDAIAWAKERFADERLKADLRWQDLTFGLPFQDNTFDLVIDRAALTYYYQADETIEEIHRVLVPGGKFLFTPYGPGSDRKTTDYGGLVANYYDAEAVHRVLPARQWRELERYTLKRTGIKTTEEFYIISECLKDGPEIIKSWRDWESVKA